MLNIPKSVKRMHHNVECIESSFLPRSLFLRDLSCQIDLVGILEKLGKKTVKKAAPVVEAPAVEAPAVEAPAVEAPAAEEIAQNEAPAVQ